MTTRHIQLVFVLQPRTHLRQRLRMLTCEEIEHAFAHQAAKIKGITGTARADQQAQLDRALVGFGHLGHADAPIP